MKKSMLHIVLCNREKPDNVAKWRLNWLSKIWREKILMLPDNKTGKWNGKVKAKEYDIHGTQINKCKENSTAEKHTGTGLVIMRIFSDIISFCHNLHRIATYVHTTCNSVSHLPGRLKTPTNSVIRSTFLLNNNCAWQSDINQIP